MTEQVDRDELLVSEFGLEVADALKLQNGLRIVEVAD